MKKIFASIFFVLLFCNTGFAESYYFKECKLNETVSGDYLIDFNNNQINVTLESTDGRIQEFTDQIKLITKDRVISEIIQQKNKKFSTQYFLDADSRSIIRQLYKKDTGLDLIRPEGPPSQNFCENVKADWDKSKKKKTTNDEKLEEKLQTESDLPKCVGNNIKLWTNCHGRYDSGDGYKYIGEWKDGKQNRKGVELWKDGKKYIGEFKNDERNGQGTLTLSDGTEYTGEWKDGKKDGQGTYIWSNGDKYIGEFKENKQHGKGILTYVSGKIYSGKYRNGKLVEGTAADPDGTKYVGEFNFDKPHGQGTLIYSNGAKFVGQFVDGYEYGEGICFKPDGSKLKCLLIEDRDTYLGKNKYSISIIGEWVKLDEQIKSKEQLLIDFDKKASKFCLSTGTGRFNVFKRKVDVKEIDETPAFGLNPVYKLGIDGIIICK